MTEYRDKLIDYGIPVILSLVLATLLQLPQLANHVGLIGADTVFHFSRFYDTAQQIQNHNFSYFQMNYGMGETGRIVNAIYGPFFAYVLGALLLVAGSWLRFQILLVYLLFVISGIGMYQLGIKLKMSRVVATILASLFLLTGYIYYWIPSNSFYAWGAALMPYVLMQGVALFNDGKRRFNWINLALTMAIVGQVHLLSTLLAILVLIPFFIYGLLSTADKKRMWRDTVKAVMLCLILTANVWGAFLVLYPTNLMGAPLDFSPVLTALRLKSAGTITAWVQIQEVIILLFALQLLYVTLNYKKLKLNLFFTIEGTIFLFVSSDLFPWQFVQRHYPAVSNYFQFPNRFTAIAYPLLFIGIGLTVKRLTEKYDFQFKFLVEAFLIIVCLFNFRADFQETTQKVNDVKPNIERLNDFRDKNLTGIINKNHTGNPDYLPLKEKKNSWDIAGIVSEKLNKDNGYNKQAISGGRLKIEWQGDQDKQTILPITIYNQSRLLVNGKKINPKLNEIGMPIVQSKRGKNTAILSFKTPAWFTTLLYISILGWVMMLIYGVFKLVKIAKK